MGKGLMGRVGMTAAMLALLMAGYGCAGGAGRGPGGAGPVGPDAGPGLSGTQAGVTGAGRTGGPPATGGRTEVGQQISDLIAAIDGLDAIAPGRTTVGNDERAGPVGVSTLVLDNQAFVAIDAATLAGSGKVGDLTGGTMGGLPGAVSGIPWGPDLRVGPSTAPGASASSSEVQQMIRSYVTVVFPQIGDVFITTDPATVHRIARLSAHMQAGSPTPEQMAEARSIADGMRSAREGGQ